MPASSTVPTRPPRQGRSLACKYPTLCEEWHPERNGDVTPRSLSPSSRMKVWWRCSGCGNEWQATPMHRAMPRDGRKGGCPACAGNSAGPDRNLAEVNPELAAEWHPQLNGDLTASAVTPRSGRSVWWWCSEHQAAWKARVASRSRGGHPCPQHQAEQLRDRSLAALHPGVAADWHPSRNVCRPDAVLPAQQMRAWWLCGTCGWEWQTLLLSRTANGSGCPACAGKVATPDNNLLSVRPDLAAEWHPTLNGSTTAADVTAGSRRRSWWRCRACSWEWPATPANRHRAGTGCPGCAGKVATPNRNLAVVRPDLIDEWDHEANGTLRPEALTPKTPRRVWWRCRTCGHRWNASPLSRVKDHHGCGRCARSRGSLIEAQLWHEIDKFAPLRPRGMVVRTPDSPHGLVPDLLLAEAPLVIEFDGLFFHRDVARDERRNREYAAVGLDVLRLRSEGLPKIGPTDLRVPRSVYSTRCPGHQVAAMLLPELERRLGRPLAANGLTVAEYVAAGEPLHADPIAEFRPHFRRRTTDELAEADLAMLSAQGWTAGSIAEAYRRARSLARLADALGGMDRDRASRLVRHLGISTSLEDKARTARSSAELADADIAALAERGVDRDAVAALYAREGTLASTGAALGGWSEKRVIRLMNRLGIPRRHTSESPTPRTRNRTELAADDAADLAQAGWDRDSLIALYAEQGALARVGKALGGWSASRVARLSNHQAIDRQVGGWRARRATWQ